MPFPNDFYQYLSENTLVGIKAGNERDRFIDIWVVEVNMRIFARTWSKSENSWFTTFLRGENGKIKYGDRAIDIVGQKKKNDPELTRLINQAYLRKYNQPENIFYAQGITKPEYEEYTLEFLPI